jgi:fructose-specific phosphotransferase system IIC component
MTQRIVIWVLFVGIATVFNYDFNVSGLGCIFTGFLAGMLAMWVADELEDSKHG